MRRAVRERPRRIGAATLALVAVLAIGWLAGAGAAGSTPGAATRIPTVVSTTTETVTQTVIAHARQPPSPSKPRYRHSRRT